MIIEHQACLLLGSNIEPEVNIPRAVLLLRHRLTILKLSSVWESASVDCCYPDYLNMAVLVATQKNVHELKQELLLPLEAKMGRVRTDDKNAPRTIDIDIILFDGEVIDPDLWHYVHRAVPVSEVLPKLCSPDGELLKEDAWRLAASTPIRKRTDIHIPV